MLRPYRSDLCAFAPLRETIRIRPARAAHPTPYEFFAFFAANPGFLSLANRQRLFHIAFDPRMFRQS